MGLRQNEPFSYIFTFIIYDRTNFGDDPSTMTDEDIQGVRESNPNKDFVVKIGILCGQYNY